MIPIKVFRGTDKRCGSRPGAVLISTMDCPTGRQTIVPCDFSIAERSIAQSDGPLCLLKQPPGLVSTSCWLFCWAIVVLDREQIVVHALTFKCGKAHHEYLQSAIHHLMVVSISSRQVKRENWDHSGRVQQATFSGRHMCVTTAGLGQRYMTMLNVWPAIGAGRKGNWLGGKGKGHIICDIGLGPDCLK